MHNASQLFLNKSIRVAFKNKKKTFETTHKT